MIIGVAIKAGVMPWINMKRALSTAGCHAVVEFMHRRSTTYCENGPLQIEKKDEIRIAQETPVRGP